LVRCSRFGVSRLYSQPLGSYGGWVGRSPQGQSGVVSDWLRRLKRPSVAELVITPWHTDGTIAYPGRKVTRERFVIDLSGFSEGQSWKTNLRRNVVRNLKSATLHSWKIELVRNPDDVERTRELWQQTFTRHRRRLDQSSWELYRLLPEFFAPGDRLFWWTASDEHGPAGTIICLLSGDRFFYYDGAMDISRRDGRPMYALFNAAINTALRFSCRFFDFGSGPDHASGLARFKQGWGALPEAYCEYHFKRVWWPKGKRHLQFFR